MNAKVEPLISPLKMQDASLDIWSTKYQLKTKSGEAVDQDISQTYARVAKALASVEAESKRAEVMEDFKWALENGVIPAGRIISNAGAGEHKPATSTINCTVSGTVYDSMDDILLKNHEAGLTLKAGCGIGYDMFYADLTYDIGLANICHDSFDKSRNGALQFNFGVNL